MSTTQPEKITRLRLHVMLASFPRFGHIIPMFHLAKKISKFHDVTFPIAASKIPEMTARELVQPEDKINFYGIPDADVVDVLDEDKTFEEGGLQRLFGAVLSRAAKVFQDMPTKKDAGKLEGMEPVDVVIGDFLMGNEMGICHKRGVPFYYFHTANAAELYFLLALKADAPTVADNLVELFHPRPKAGVPPPPMTETLKSIVLPMQNHLQKSVGVIVNSFRDIEADVLRLIEALPQVADVKIFCVGPLLDESAKRSSVGQLAMEEQVGGWMDRQSANSVIYVSFGTVGTPTPPQLTIIGQALLQLGRPFIWAMRERFYSALPEEISSKISTQFDEADSKFLILNWAPQKTILGHKAVSVFVSHCGWNSTLESLASGKPIVGWPMFGDQLSNADFVAKSGAGVCVPDTNIACLRIVSMEELADLIEKVGGWKGEKETNYLAEARNWQTKIKATWSDTGSSKIEFLDLVGFGQSK